VILPSSVHSLDQLTTIIWEIEEALSQLQKNPQLKPQFSTSTEKLFALNSVRDFTNSTGLTIKEALEDVRKNSKQIHISTGAVTSFEWQEQIVKWFRNEVDGSLFCSFSTDTTQGGGIVVRTPKKQYDFTFKQRVLNNSDKLMELMKTK